MSNCSALPYVALALASFTQHACARPIDYRPRAPPTLASAPTPGHVANAPTYRLNLVYLDGSEPLEFVIVLNDNDSLGFKTVGALEQFLEGQPAGTELDWDPGCLRRGNEPLLSDPKALEAFQQFCATHHLKFVLHPSG